MNEKFKPKVGDYCMHHMHGKGDGTLVLINSEIKEGWFSISYVPNGGGSSAWPASEFSPVTCPIYLAKAKSHKESILASEYLAKSREAEKASKVWDAVVQILKEEKHLNPISKTINHE